MTGNLSDPGRKVVRVTGERNGMITFDYGIGDLAYAIELIMPPDAFEAFCRENAVARLDGDCAEPQDDVARGMALRPSQVGPRI
mgnify:CR=1 FL=1